jgi:hypothetical protein
MNFYYDPILGLQYDYLGDLFIIDIVSAPKSTIEKLLQLISQLRIIFLETSLQIQQIVNITDYKIR